MSATPQGKPVPLSVRLIHERDTKNFAVYSTDPQGVTVKDTMYVHLDVARALGNGHVPDMLSMVLCVP